MTQATCYLYEVLDGADFNKVLARHVFTTHDEGDFWAKYTVEYYRERSREAGETDECFINAIDSTWDIIDFN